MLDIKSLMVFYENALAVNNLNLDVRKGEIVGVFGSNSAGKTTLINTIAGLTLHLKWREQRKGGQRITIVGAQLFEDEDIGKLSPSERVKKGIVLCRERHPVFRDLAVEENLRLGGFLIKNQAKVKKSIDLVYSIFPPLTKLKTRKAGLCSGGEQEMIAIGMALVARPKLLLLDEPLLGLSPAMQAIVVQALKDIRKLEVTVLLTEQYARPIMPHIDRGFIIENGTLIMSGTQEELMDNPEVISAYFGM
ncbi:MAG TPA: ABC transporter ATP-binding protein [Firmicutes bacterium]|nr:ABC transporter ATP-binding protein [Bacillota bacterium]